MPTNANPFTPAPPLAANLAGGATLIVLPVDDRRIRVERNGVWYVLTAGSGVFMDCGPNLSRSTRFTTNDMADVERAMLSVCPLTPGETYYVRERWATAIEQDHLKPSELTLDNVHAIMFPISLGVWAVRGKGYCAFTHGSVRPRQHMPAWAARTTFTVATVELRRVNTITEAEAIAYGIQPIAGKPGVWKRYSDEGTQTGQPIKSFANLFMNTHGREAWDENRWCWFVSIDNRKGIER
jgi:hypothetical protein